MDFTWSLRGSDEHDAGAAMRRRQRRLRSRHERMTVAMALTEMTHHTAPRGPKMARAGEGRYETQYTAEIRETPLPPRPPPPAGALQFVRRRARREAPLHRPRVLVPRHIMERLAGVALPWCPLLLYLCRQRSLCVTASEAFLSPWTGCDNKGAGMW